MPAIYNATIKTARMTATRDACAGGTLELLSAADAVLATFTLSGTGGSVAGDVWTLAFVVSTVAGSAAAGAGTAATKAQVKASGGTAVITGLTVATTGADINLVNTNIAESQNVTLSSATVTHAA